MSLLEPHRYLASVDRIDTAELAGQGFTALLLDIDNTLVPRNTKQLTSQVRQWVQGAKRNGLHICLLSNNWHRTVFSYARDLDVPIVYKAMKPAPFAFLRALRKIGQPRCRAVVVGDQLMTDVLGARLLGLTVMLVQPQSTVDLWYTRIFRRIEGRVLHGRQPE